MVKISNGNYLLYLFSLFRLCYLISCQRASSSSRADVYIAGFFPYGEGVENSETGRGVMPSVKLALDHVNEHQNILKNYRLHMWWNDTECNAAVGVKSFFDMMHSGPHKLMLFGAACTHVTDPIAKASKHWHLTQLSYADTHPMFTKDSFPNFFRVVPSENAFNAPRLALLKHFNWTRIGTIYQNEPRYSLPHNHLVADLDAIDMEVVETQSFVTDVRESLKKLKEKDVRIILGNFHEYWARQIFCEAYKLDMYGRSYQWLIMGAYSNNWWNVSGNCTQEELNRALESTILVDLLPLSTTKDITVSGITAEEYLTEYDRRRSNEYSRFHGYTYDGIWAVALAIQYVVEKKDQISNFQYRVKEWESVFLEALRNTSFEGVTGPVRFYNNERKAGILLKQFQRGHEVKVGEFSTLTSQLSLSFETPMKWGGRSPPKDRTLIIIEHTQVNMTIYIILASCSVIGIIIAIIFLVVNIKFRNQRYIKMSSPHLNNLIIIGCMLTYLSVIFLGLDSGLSSVSAFPYICTIRAWLLMAGFSLAFGAMFSKTWRVHSIFTDLKLNKKVIKDYQLFMVVGVLLAIDLAIMTTWQFADPFYRSTKQMEPVHHPTLEDVLIIRENEYCQSERITIFIGIIYAYKGLLLIFGAFLAWETRHVSIPALNDSKHIGLSVYNCVIMCVMGAAIALIISDQKDAVFVLISVFIQFCTTGTLCLVFVPKVNYLVELQRNPSGVVDRRCRATLRPMSKNRRDSSVCELEQRLRDVKTTNCRFRKVLLERETELQNLIRKVGPEARKWIEAGTGDTEILTQKDNLKLSVPMIRRELPSTTETTDLTSIASLNSANNDNQIIHTPLQSKKINQAQQLLQQTAVQNKPVNSCYNTPQHQQLNHQISNQRIQQSSKTNVSDDTAVNQCQQTVLHQQQYQQNIQQQFQQQQQMHLSNPSLTKNAIETKSFQRAFDEPQSSPEHKSIHSECCPDSHERAGSSTRNSNKENVNGVLESSNFNRYKVPVNSTSISHSNSELNSCCQHGKGSNKNLNIESRRVSVHIGSSLKNNFVVPQSDLWDTHTLSHAKQHSRQSPRNHPNNVRTCQEHSQNTTQHDRECHSPGPIQRSVSEKNRTKHRHKPKISMCQSETDSEKERETTPTTTQKKLGKSIHSSHHHSSPNVAPDKYKKHRNKTESSIYGACSESELLFDGDTAILPIFRKLLTEKEPRYRSRNNIVGASCPNISIKCDIVEYL